MEISGDLRFAVTDDQLPALDGFCEPESGFYGSLLSQSRWMLAAAAALGSRTLVEIRVGGRGWRQELTGTAPSRPVPFDAPGEASGTRVTFELDAAFLTPAAIISTSAGQWPARQRLRCVRGGSGGGEAHQGGGGALLGGAGDGAAGDREGGDFAAGRLGRSGPGQPVR